VSGLPEYYASTLDLPFNRTCIDSQFVLESPTDDPGGMGYGLLLGGNMLLAKNPPEGITLPYGEWNDPLSLYLGRWQGKPCRLITLEGGSPLPEGLEPFGLLDDKPLLPIELLSLGGLGRMILHWQARSSFCGYCGQSTDWMSGEWGRKCNSCGAHSFPAIHPCAIVLVRRPGQVLLTRKAEWAPNRYSLVAGFQEFGESLEETAIREIAEETGIVANNVRYVGSQCWPFPSQVMVGFVADYVSGEVEVDTTELDDARWFSVDDLPALPPKRSIARYILDTAMEQS
jgi:NAD+ diphosphatase